MARQGSNPSGPTPELARLAGPRLVLANETEDGQRLAESLVKQLTGGDAMTARVLHGAPFDFIPQFKLWLAGNHKPIIRGDDFGIWRRIVLIPFEKQFTGAEKNKHLAENLRVEYAGILNWIIQGSLLWQKHGLAAPDQIQKQVDAYKSEMDLLQQWLDEHCMQSAGISIPARTAYRSFSSWAKCGGHNVFSESRFAQKMTERGFEKKRTARGTRYVGLDIKHRNFSI